MNVSERRVTGVLYFIDITPVYLIFYFVLQDITSEEFRFLLQPGAAAESSNRIWMHKYVKLTFFKVNYNNILI